MDDLSYRVYLFRHPPLPFQEGIFIMALTSLLRNHELGTTFASGQKTAERRYNICSYAISMDLLTADNLTIVLGFITIISVLFAIYIYFKDPQTAEEKKAALLAQEVRYTSESTDRRFADVQKSITDAFALGQNHIHSVDVKVDALTAKVSGMQSDIVRLATIIDERIPKRTP